MAAEKTTRRKNNAAYSLPMGRSPRLCSGPATLESGAAIGFVPECRAWGARTCALGQGLPLYGARVRDTQRPPAAPGGASGAGRPRTRRAGPAGRAALLGPAACALALLGAACGSPGAPDAASTTSTTSATTTTTLAPGTLRFGAPEPLTGGTALVAVSCASPTACIAVDATGRAFAFNGSSWGAPQSPAGAATGPGTISVSCASPTLCLAAPTGGNQTVTWNGQSWSAPVTVEGAAGIEGIGCAPSGYCAAVDGEGNAFAYRGGGWGGTSGDWGAVTAISCVSQTFCVSSSGGLSIWDGGSWTTPQTYGVPTSFTDVSCPTTSFCMAVDELGQALVWNGQAWSAPMAADPLGAPLTGVSCPTATFCVAVDKHGGILQWHAGTWSRTDADSSAAMAGVSCPTATFCMAVDHSGRVVVGRPA